MKQFIYALVILSFTEGVAQSASAIELSKTYQDRAIWFRQLPQFDRDSMFFYFQKAIDVLEQAQPRPYKHLAQAYATHAEYSQRFHVHNIVAKLADKAWENWQQIPPKEKNKELQYDILFFRALGMIEQGKNTTALNLYEQAYECLYKDPRPEIQAKVLKDKGYFYVRFGIPEQQVLMEEAFNKSLQLYAQLNDTLKYGSDISRIYTNFVVYFMNKNQFDSCQYFLNKLEELKPYYTHPYLEGWTGMVEGEMWLMKGDYTISEQKLHASTNILEKYRLHKSNVYQYDLFLLGNIYKKKGEYDKAIDYYKQSKTIAEALKYRETIRDDLLALSETYELKGDKEQALVYYKQYLTEYSEIIKMRSQRSMKEKELQIDVLNKEQEIDTQRTERNFSLIVVGLFGLLSFFIYKNYRSQKKSNAILKLRNEEKEFLIKEIHHRVKNNLQVLSSLLHLQSKHIKDENALDAVREGQNRVEAMGLIHQKLYMGDNLASVEMQDYLKNLGDVLIDSLANDDRIKIHYDVKPMHLDVDTAIPMGLIINELMTNSLKYAFPNGREGTVNIALWKNGNGKLNLKVSDDGVGKNAVVTTKQSTSFGASLVQMLSKKLKGTIETQNTEGGYSTLIAFENFKMNQ